MPLDAATTNSGIKPISIPFKNGSKKHDLSNPKILSEFKAGGIEQALRAIDDLHNTPSMQSFFSAAASRYGVSEDQAVEIFKYRLTNLYNGRALPSEMLSLINATPVQPSHSGPRIPSRLAMQQRRLITVPPHDIIEEKKAWGRKTDHQDASHFPDNVSTITQEDIAHLKSLVGPQFEKFRKKIQKAIQSGGKGAFDELFRELKIFKFGANSSKFGGITREDVDLSSSIFIYMTKEERSSCPSNCYNYDECFGDTTENTKRVIHTPEYNEYLELALEFISKIFYPYSVILRPHEVGDFENEGEIATFVKGINDHPNLTTWITTHRHALVSPEAFCDFRNTLDMHEMIESAKLGTQLFTASMQNPGDIRLQFSTPFLGIPGTMHSVKRSDVESALEHPVVLQCPMHHKTMTPKTSSAQATLTVAAQKTQMMCVGCALCPKVSADPILGRQTLLEEHGVNRAVGGGQVVINSFGLLRYGRPGKYIYAVSEREFLLSLKKVRDTDQNVSSHGNTPFWQWIKTGTFEDLPLITTQGEWLKSSIAIAKHLPKPEDFLTEDQIERHGSPGSAPKQKEKVLRREYKLPEPVDADTLTFLIEPTRPDDVTDLLGENTIFSMPFQDDEEEVDIDAILAQIDRARHTERLTREASTTDHQPLPDPNPKKHSLIQDRIPSGDARKPGPNAETIALIKELRKKSAADDQQIDELRQELARLHKNIAETPEQKLADGKNKKPRMTKKRREEEAARKNVELSAIHRIIYHEGYIETPKSMKDIAVNRRISELLQQNGITDHDVMSGITILRKPNGQFILQTPQQVIDDLRSAPAP